MNELPELESEETHETSARTILKSKTLIRSSKVMLETSNYPPQPHTKRVYNPAPHADEQPGCDCGDDPHEVLEPETEIETVNPPGDELSEIQSEDPHVDEQPNCECGEDPPQNEPLKQKTEIENVDPPEDELSEMQSEDPHTDEIETVDPPMDELSEMQSVDQPPQYDLPAPSHAESSTHKARQSPTRTGAVVRYNNNNNL